MTLNSSFFLCCADAAAAAAIAPLKKNRQADLCGALKKKILVPELSAVFAPNVKGVPQEVKVLF